MTKFVSHIHHKLVGGWQSSRHLKLCQLLWWKEIQPGLAPAVNCPVLEPIHITFTPSIGQNYWHSLSQPKMGQEVPSCQGPRSLKEIWQKHSWLPQRLCILELVLCIWGHSAASWEGNEHRQSWRKSKDLFAKALTCSSFEPPNKFFKCFNKYDNQGWKPSNTPPCISVMALSPTQRTRACGGFSNPGQPQP